MSVTPPRPGTVRNRATDAHEAAVAHLEALAPYSEWSDEEEPDPDAMPATADVWCGCETCVIREALAAAWPHALAYAADLVATALPVHVNAGASAAAKLLRAEARRSLLAGQELPA